MASDAQAGRSRQSRVGLSARFFLQLGLGWISPEPATVQSRFGRLILYAKDVCPLFVIVAQGASATQKLVETPRTPLHIAMVTVILPPDRVAIMARHVRVGP